MKTDKNKRFRSHKTLFAIITIVLIVLTVLGGIRESDEYLNNLNLAGISGALNGSTLLVLLAGLTLIISFVYLFSSWRSDRHARKKFETMARKAREAQARGEDYTIEAPPIGKRVGSVLSTVLDAVTKIIISFFIIALIGVGGFSTLKENEFRNRPVYDVLEGYDLTGAVTGYDGLAYVDEDLIEYGLKDDVTEILKEGKNYKGSKDYSEEQALWLQVKNNLKFEISPDTSDVGTLSNGDTVTVTATLPGYSLPQLESDLGIDLTGIDEKKEFTVDGLPYKFDSAEQALSEKLSFIDLAVKRVRDKANENCNDFKGIYYSNYQLYGAYLCKPDERPGYNPDALLVIGTYERQAGTEYASRDTVILYAYPFDSSISETDMDNEFVPLGKDGVRVITEVHSYKTPEQFLESFKTGRYLSATAGYILEKINYTE